MRNCLRALSMVIKVCERNVFGGFRTHSGVSKSEASVLRVRRIWHLHRPLEVFMSSPIRAAVCIEIDPVFEVHRVSLVFY